MRCLVGLVTGLLVFLRATTLVIAHSGDEWIIYVSDSPTRSNPSPLEGQVDISEDIYVFASPETDVQQVKFFIDEDVSTGTPVRTENFAPFDLAGGETNAANAYDTFGLVNGWHIIRALMTFNDGDTLEITATFFVNNAATEYSLLVSTNGDRSNPVELDGSTLGGGVAIFTSPDTFVDSVEFYLDGTLERTEGRAPYDFEGGTAALANLWDTNTDSDGSHTVSVVIIFEDGSSQNLQATFVISNNGPNLPTASPTSSPTLAPATSPVYSVLVSYSNDRSNAVDLEGEVLAGVAYVFTAPDDDVDRVNFYLEGPNFPREMIQSEGNGPFDWAGTNSDGSAQDEDTTLYDDGEYTLEAECIFDDGSTLVLTVAFSIANNSPPPPTSSPTSSPTLTPTQSSAPTRTFMPSESPTMSSAPTPIPVCFDPMFLTGFVENTNVHPLPLGEPQGIIIGNDFVTISGSSVSWTEKTLQNWAKDSTIPDSPWRRLDDLPVPDDTPMGLLDAEGITHGAFFVHEMKFYMCGGLIGASSIGSGPQCPYCFIYDHAAPNGTQWDESVNFPDLPYPVGYESNLLAGTGGGAMIFDSATRQIIYTLGGTRLEAYNKRSTRDVTDIWVMDMDDMSAGWTRVGDAPYAGNHVGSTTVVIDDVERHFILGGQIEEDERNGNLDEVWELVVNPDGVVEWIAHTPMPFARGHFSSSVTSFGCGFIISGGSTNDGRTSDISYYNVLTREWTKIGDLPAALNTPICGVSPPNSEGTQYYVCEGGFVNGEFSYTREIGLMV